MLYDWISCRTRTKPIFVGSIAAITQVEVRCYNPPVVLVS